MIIAEIGQNHMGNMELARHLIVEAKDNGADLVKFQLYDSKKLYGEWQRSELTKEQAQELFNYGKDFEIEVFFSVFDLERIQWCEEIGVKRYKLACHWARRPEMSQALTKIGKPVIISDNPSKPGRISPTCDITWLYCIPKYPASLSELQFSRIKFGGNAWDGFSDHTIGLDAAKIAIARGAKVIEKHFAVDHDRGVDAQWSMTPDELKELKRWDTAVKESM